MIYIHNASYLQSLILILVLNINYLYTSSHNKITNSLLTNNWSSYNSYLSALSSQGGFSPP